MGAGFLSGLVGTLGSVSGVTLAGLAAYLVAMLFLGRSLSREAFGYLNLWLSGMNVLAAVSLLGYPLAIVRHYPRERLVRSRWTRLLRPLTALNAAVALAGAAAFARIYDFPVRDAVWLFAASALVGQTQLPATILQIFRRFVVAQGLANLWRVGLLVAVAAALPVHALRPSLAFVAVGSGAALQLVLAQVAIRREPGGEEATPLRPLLADAALFTALTAAAMLLTRLDAFVLAKVLDLDALGLYSALSFYTLTGYGVVALAVGQVLRPKLASREPVPGRRLAWGLAASGLGVGAILALASTRVVPALLSDRYAGDHRGIVMVLAAAGTFQVLYALPSSVIGVLSSRRTLVAFVPVSLITVGVDVVLLAVCVPRWGLPGAAGATAATWVVRWGSAWIVARSLR
jgi:O-antigen/teichoic acid export membrane protein